MLAEFEPDGAVLLLSMRKDGTDVQTLKTQSLEGQLTRYYTGGNFSVPKKVVLSRGTVRDERGWAARWEPSDASYWTKAHTLHVTVNDTVYAALERDGEYCMKPVWE